MPSRTPCTLTAPTTPHQQSARRSHISSRVGSLRCYAYIVRFRGLTRKSCGHRHISLRLFCCWTWPRKRRGHSRRDKLHNRVGLCGGEQYRTLSPLFDYRSGLPRHAQPYHDESGRGFLWRRKQHAARLHLVDCPACTRGSDRSELHHRRRQHHRAYVLRHMGQQYE